ncbi:MAG: type II secretion system protein [Phycisphaerales bacterium]|nr:type II secretion system protein [Phycisphaerales bacterium]
MFAPASSSSLSPARPRRGFTLLEVMVVGVLLAVLAAIAVPRLTGNTRRSFDLAADQVADLLLMYAQRDAFGAKPIGLMKNERGWLMLVQLDIDASDERSGDWRIDPFVPPVKFPDEVDLSSVVVTANGQRLDIIGQPLSHTPGEDRPSVQVFMQSRDREYQTTIDLAPHALAPVRSDRRTGTPRRVAVDLDAAGRSREDW